MQDSAYVCEMKRGRPRVGENPMQHTIPVRFTDELLSEIDEVCRQMAASGITRSQAIRQLLMEAIVSRKRAKK